MTTSWFKAKARVSGATATAAGAPAQIEFAPLSTRNKWLWRIVAAICGAITGLAAPGLECWFLPWLTLSALMALTATAQSPWLASVRGYYFGIFYNLVYMSWLLLFRPEYCAGVYICPLAVVNFTFWILLAGMQGIYLSVVPCLIRALPVSAGWWPTRYQGRWHLPGFVVWPLLWILVDRLCNTTQLLGIPLTTLHYTQYRQLEILRLAPLIGGVGITALIVLVNANLLAWLTFGQSRFAAVTCGSRFALYLNTALTVMLFAVLYYAAPNYAAANYGAPNYAAPNYDAPNQPEPRYAATNYGAAISAAKKTVTVVALQANLSEKLHHTSAVTLLDKYLHLCQRSPQDVICVWPEWSFAASFSKSPKLYRSLAILSKISKQSWVIGTADKGQRGELYNAICAIESSGRVLSQVYHKRYLVPVGEYLPDWIKDTPIRLILFGAKQHIKDTNSGEEAIILPLSQARIAPLICFEAAYPKLCAQSVKAGGELLVDSSDNSWFYSSILSDQMVSFCVLRAVENHRSFVFATALGPSTIIDSTGHIVAQAPRQKEATVQAVIPLENDLTPYTRWCF